MKNSIISKFAFCALVATTACGKDNAEARGYINGKWVMKEREIAVLAPDGKPSTRHSHWQSVGPVTAEIVWTWNQDYSWNYTANPTPKDQDLPGPSIPVFMRKQLGAKTVLWTAIVGTPFRLATINGKFAPILWDTDKDVLWRLKGLELAMAKSDTIIVQDRKAELIQTGGDWAAFLTIDLTDQEKGITLKYRERFDGF